jgi:biotin-dependent carboxylase-like uncharacterized protein
VTRAIEVLEPGLFTTIQDLGRPGHARLGVSAAGAADPIALRLANRLAGNADGAPALEMTLQGGAFRFGTDAVVALGGADMEASLDGRALPAWMAARAGAGSTLRCGVARRGARAILAVAGGIAVPPILGSASTHVASALGGIEGRVLRRGDRLSFGPPPAGGAVPLRRLDPAALARLACPPAMASSPAIRVTRGAQWDAIPAAARQAFLDGSFTVSATSDRMGIRLDGTRVENAGGGHMITEGMPLGAVQVPPGGQPVILFVDHQTTGGYPVIAAVVSADLARLGQLRPGEPVRFALVTFEEARAFLFEQARWLEGAEMVDR